MTMKFEWDENKNLINKEKHGISFEVASLVFNDPYYIEMYDFEHSVDEDRYMAIGKVDDVLFVVFTERKESIRLISARIATPTERRLYYDQNSNS
ncbi:MAG: BrnT family toxin [Oscillospiraceae bacterium]|nr:BrnT family toxin [Oscillospiraceae bacterium]